MPCLQVRVNIKLTEQQKKEATLALSKIVASGTGKPEGYVMVIVQDDVAMSFGGTNDPCVFMDLRSIGCIDRKSNKKYSAALSKYWSDTHKIPADRCYISFQNAPGENWGYDGDTFG